MRRLLTILLTLFSLVSALASAADGPAAAPFKLSSPVIAPGGKMARAQEFNGFGCTGGNESPALSWANPPAGTKSFALMVHDPDAPTGSGFWHWVAWNIPANVLALPARAGDPQAGLMPAGVVQGRTDFGTPGYGGPCPPPGSGNHHYHFRLHALKVEKLDLPPDPTAALVGFNVIANTIATAELTGLYSR